MIQGWYYLHINGDLIYKRELGDTVADLRESDFVRGIWPVDPTNREGAWDIVVEALAAGADKLRVFGLAVKWGCNDEDAEIYAARRNVVIERDGDAWCAKGPGFENLQESPAGFGETKLEAMAELCKELGYKPSKAWGARFRDLVSRAKFKNPPQKAVAEKD